MANNQQRSARERRSVTANAPVLRADILWQIATVIANVVTLDLSGFSGELVLNGIPAFVLGPFALVPTGATVAASVLTLTFAAPVDMYPWALSLGSQDAALRTSFAGFLSGGVQHFALPPAPPNLSAEDCTVGGVILTRFAVIREAGLRIYSLSGTAEVIGRVFVGIMQPSAGITITGAGGASFGPFVVSTALALDFANATWTATEIV